MTPVYLPPHRRRVSVLALLAEAAVIAAGFYTLGFALVVLGALIAS
jgi:hypothetical protein